MHVQLDNALTQRYYDVLRVLLLLNIIMLYSKYSCCTGLDWIGLDYCLNNEPQQIIFHICDALFERPCFSKHLGIISEVETQLAKVIK